MAVSKPSLAIFGGNGYLGSNIVKHVLKKYPHIHVISINRSGRPSFGAQDNVEYHSGDASDPTGGSWIGLLKERNIKGCISCVGAFGSNKFMLEVNGTANCNVIELSKAVGIPNFVYVSTVENNLPDFILKGYFEGKRKAEQQLLMSYPETGVVLRPGFIYGTRQLTSSFGLPLGLIGYPMKTVLSLPGFNSLQNLPGMKAVLSPPVCVEHVSAVAAAGALGGLDVKSDRIVSGEEISAKGELLCR